MNPEAEKIRELRYACGMSQHDFAVLLGVKGAATISRWECGIRRPNDVTMKGVEAIVRAYLGRDP